MSADFERFLLSSEQDRRDAFGEVASRLKTLPDYIEKDFWICVVLDILFNKLPDGHPRLLFKGGTSLSKAFNLIKRFSEDVDLVVYREDLGFDEEHDPTAPKEKGLSNSKRKALFKKLNEACENYIRKDLADALNQIIGEQCQIVPDDRDPDRQSLLIKYPTLYANDDASYVSPQVKLEGGARSALDPNITAAIKPYVAEELGDDWSLTVPNIRVIKPHRTCLDKLIILHGIHCGYRDQGRMLEEGSRVARHYYDMAMLTGTEIGKTALVDHELLKDVRKHSAVAFRQAWKKLHEAVPGSVCIYPQDGLLAVLEADYKAMRHMIFGDVPEFKWILEQIRIAEDIVNRR
ncbi:MAG: nucleotidyl transferase AbiEii/AbiGii toxin family protein [Hyphomicrobiales bacterium]|nr:nucleotidyl transferase AbiEii/AbiGii toxin family protein [Hyphomicrobiales bacterium]MCY4038398.1 nucleotidyl transferase AbiEii/AbiGii toxin family protein [Hyphomicrobiales bacterium]